MRSPSLLGGLLLLVALTGGCSDLRGTGDVEYVAGDGTVVQVAEPDRGDPVEIAGDSLEGDPVEVADWRGDVVVVNVWGSWCGPCRAEADLLVRADEELDARFVGINIRDETSRALAFEREYGVEYPSIHDPGSEQLLRFGPEHAPRATPSTFVLDREGRVAAMISGEVPSVGTLRELVEEVAAEDG